jgi:hypothetical protein
MGLTSGGISLRDAPELAELSQSGYLNLEDFQNDHLLGQTERD